MTNNLIIEEVKADTKNSNKQLIYVNKYVILENSSRIFDTTSECGGKRKFSEKWRKRQNEISSFNPRN